MEKGTPLSAQSVTPQTSVGRVPLLPVKVSPPIGEEELRRCERALVARTLRRAACVTQRLQCPTMLVQRRRIVGIDIRAGGVPCGAQVADTGLSRFTPARWAPAARSRRLEHRRSVIDIPPSGDDDSIKVAVRVRPLVQRCVPAQLDATVR
jgi:hypothetical protein